MMCNRLTGRFGAAALVVGVAAALLTLTGCHGGYTSYSVGYSDAYYGPAYGVGVFEVIEFDHHHHHHHHHGHHHHHHGHHHGHHHHGW